MDKRILFCSNEPGRYPVTLILENASPKDFVMTRVRQALLFTSLAGCLTWLGASLINGQDPPTKDAKAGIMRLKLIPAKMILEGIALHDFKAVRKNSEQLRLLTLDASWMLVQTEAYTKQTADFERALKLLNRMCEEENIEGVTLAYMQVTMRCVECHRALRDGSD
jgi:hypothetical protein